MLIAQMFADQAAHFQGVLSTALTWLAPLGLMVAMLAWVLGAEFKQIAPMFVAAIGLLSVNMLVSMFGVPVGAAPSLAPLIGTFFVAMKGISILAILIAVRTGLSYGAIKYFDPKRPPKKSRQEIRTEKQIEALEQIKRDLDAIDVDPDRTALRKRLMAEATQQAKVNAPNNAVVARNGIAVGSGRLWVSPSSVTHTACPAPSKTPEKSGESA